jgi:hypothetical protein
LRVINLFEQNNTSQGCPRVTCCSSSLQAHDVQVELTDPTSMKPKIIFTSAYPLLKVSTH